MKRTEREAINRFIRDALPLLGLPQWQIEVSDKPVDDDTTDEANIDPDDSSHCARLRLGNSFWAAAPDEQRRILAHELLHLIAYRTTDYVGSLKKFVPADLWAHFWEEFEKREDIMIEDLTQLLAGTLPPLRLPRRKR